MIGVRQKTPGRERDSLAPFMHCDKLRWSDFRTVTASVSLHQATTLENNLVVIGPQGATFIPDVLYDVKSLGMKSEGTVGLPCGSVPPPP